MRPAGKMMEDERTVGHAVRQAQELRVSARRQEHLAGLGLPIIGREVLEIGTGTGSMTSFLLDRGCRVTSLDPDPDAVTRFRARHPDIPSDRLTIVSRELHQLAASPSLEPHPVVVCYGVLNTLDDPQAALRTLAACCSDLLVLELAVSYAEGDTMDGRPGGSAGPEAGVADQGCRPSRRWIYDRLSKLFDFVYMPLTQPAHPEFRLDWRCRTPPAGSHRAVFVAARTDLMSSVLVQGVPDLQYAELPQLGSLVAKEEVSVIAPQTVFGATACFPGDLLTRQLLRFGAHTRNELAMLLRFVEAGDLVYDVGAHIGTFAVPLAAAVGQAGRLIAIEADPANFTKLTQNLGSRGFVQSTAIHAAIGEVTGPLTWQRAAGNTGAGFLMPATDGPGEAPPMRGLDELHREVGQGRRAAVLKIDVEGMELSVLRTALDLLRRDKPILYIEISDGHLARFGQTPSELDTLLAELGYRFYRNVGDRNSDHDRFDIRRLQRVSDGGRFYDLLAVASDHPSLAGIEEGYWTVPATA